MKPLIFILLTAIAAEAQSLPEIARRERARQSQIESKRVYTTESAKNPLAAPAAAATITPPPAAPAPAAPPARPNAAAPVDPARKYAEDVAKLRTRVRELTDQEAAIQLQINDLNAKFFAPVSDQASKDAAQAQLTTTQQQLTAVRQELTTTRAQLQQMEAQGPPAAR